jgi:hypothetical protein
VVCASRIKKVVEAKAIQVLVQALDSELSTSKTKLSAATAFKQICVEASVRGKFIVEGGLKCCLSIATDTSADPQVRRLCTHVCLTNYCNLKHLYDLKYAGRPSPRLS